MSLSPLGHDEVPLSLRQATFSQVTERLPKAGATRTGVHSANTLFPQTQLAAGQSVCVGCYLHFSFEPHWRVEWNFNTGFLSQSHSKMAPWTDRRTEGLADIEATPEVSGVWLGCLCDIL